MKYNQDRPARRGFTLVELLVVIAIIGVLVAASIPAVQASRETARRTLCQGRLSQLLLALQSYENAFECYPAGTVNPDGPIRSEASGVHQSWTIALLPYLDEPNAARQFDRDKSVYDPANSTVREHWPSVLICPSESGGIHGAANYAGCHHDAEASIAVDNQGVLFLNSYLRREDVADGVSHTFFLGEKRAYGDDLGWTSGTRATLRNTGLGPNAQESDPLNANQGPTYVGGFAGPHSVGLHMALGDASVRFISETIDQRVWQQLGNRADGSLINLNSTPE